MTQLSAIGIVSQAGSDETSADFADSADCPGSGFGGPTAKDAKNTKARTGVGETRISGIR